MGSEQNTGQRLDALSADTELYAYRLERVLGSGSFGITYLARHEIFNSRHVIKEFMPDNAMREGGATVRPKSAGQADQDLFAWGLKSFFEEARMLHRLSHPSVVKVTDVFKANGTAYFVMPWLEGQTLHEWLKNHPQPDQAALLSLFVPLLEGLKYIHREKLLHRDIKPENIYVLSGGHPVLIDFGAARQALGVKSKALTQVFTAHFAPFEQYTSGGRATEALDIYSLGACLYLAVTGELPVEAPGRVQRDPQPRLAHSDFTRTYSRAFLAAIDKAMAVWPDDRFQNGLEFQQALLEEDGQAGKTSPPPPPPPPPEEPASPPPRSPEAQEPASPSSPGAGQTGTQAVTPDSPARPSAASGEPKAKKNPWPLIGAAALVVLALAGVFGAARYFGSAAVTLEREVASSTQNAQREPVPPKQSAQPEPAPPIQNAQPEPSPSPTPAKAEPAKNSTNSIGMEFVLIPAGEFLIGSSDSDRNADADEKPQHKVIISQPFYLGKYEVTQAQWEAVMGNNPSKFKSRSNPVEMVFWDDVQEFIKKLNQKEGTDKYRLPTEAEWEYAARAGTTSRYSFGDDSGDLGRYTWYDGNSGETTHPVGQKEPNGWGLYDMHGNVWEWVRDWYGEKYYAGSPAADPRGPSSGSYRVFRGGSWDDDARYCRSANRSSNTPGNRSSYLGIRVAFSSGQ